MKATLKYPVLIFDPADTGVWGFGHEADFMSSTTRILQRNDRAGVVVVDYTGTKYIIRRTYKIGWRGIWGWTGLQTGIIALENEYEDNPVKISTDTLREMIVERYLKHRNEEWFEEHWINEETFRKEFDECRTIQELIGAIVTKPKNIIWERVQEYFGFFYFLFLAILCVTILYALVRKVVLWITG